MRSRIATLILSFFILSTGSAQINSSSDIILVPDGASRHFITIENDHYEIKLENLLPNETYTVFISNEQPECLPYFIAPASENEVVLEFVADRNEQLITLGKTCESTLDIRLSIACTSCQPINDSRSLMGIMVDENYSPNQLIKDVFIGGDCFDVDEESIVSEGADLSRGYFSNGDNSINLEEGIILSTGTIHNSAGPNEDYNTGYSFQSFGGEFDLSTMVGSDFLYDVTALEFDFTPTTDQVSFEFVFASEEYCEYVASSFNDAFGFFISGPGINGPFSNNAENIALVPNTNSYTSINNVNHWNNSTYYVNNIPVTQHSDMPPNLQCTGYPVNTNGVAINNIEYDGFTTVLTAMANVQACETYHIKLVLADVADGYFDSAVFLKANSFSAGQAAEVSAQGSGDASESNIAYENCEEGYFLFERATDDLTEDLIINFQPTGLSSATPGVDYEALPNSITIPAGESIYYLPVTVYNDAFVEGTETIVLQLEAPCSCEQPNIVMFIEDVEPLVVETEDLFFCDPAPITIGPFVTGGVGNYTFSWSTGDTTATLNVLAQTDTDYFVTITDECGNVEEAVTSVSIIPIPTAFISGYQFVCPENPNADVQIDFTGDGPWNIVYSIDNVDQAPIEGITTNPFILSTSDLGTFQLESVMTYACEGTVNGAATVVETVLDIDAVTVDESCPEMADGSIEVSANGGQSPYTYNWDNGLGAVEDPTNLEANEYSLTLTDANGCTMTTLVEVNLDPNVPEAYAGTDKMLDCANPTVSLEATASTGSLYAREWTTTDGNIVSGVNTLTPMVDEPGTYNLHVTNVNTGCLVVDKTEVFIDTISPVAHVDILGPLSIDCENSSTTLDGSGSAPFGSLTFSWTTNNGNIIDVPDNLNVEVDAGGTYVLEVTNTANGCTDIESILVDADLTPPEINIQSAGLLTCLDSIATINAGNSSSGTNYSILWTTTDGNIIAGNNTLDPTVDQPGSYTLTIINATNNCENAETIQVVEDRVAPIAEAGLAIELDCNDEVAILDGGGSSSGINFTFQWSTDDGIIEIGATGLSPEVSTSGTYSLLVMNQSNGCTAEDEVLVYEDDNVPYDADIEIIEPECFGDDGGIIIPMVYGGDGPYVYSIDGGQSFYNENIFSAIPSGNVDIQIQDTEGCIYATTAFIPDAYPLFVDLEREATISLGEMYEINANVNIPLVNVSSIIWTPNETLDCTECLEPIAFPFNSTTYEITVADLNGCTASAEISIYVDKDRKIFIPNAFSPNIDGHNDQFIIYAKEGLVANISTLQVFNRWGAKVFEAKDAQPNDPTFGWDGKLKGERVNPAVYIYFAEIEFIDGETVMYKGDVTITD